MVLHEVVLSDTGGGKPAGKADNEGCRSTYSTPHQKDPALVIARDRMPLWRAISRLWLERILSDAEVSSIARILADSQYDWMELQRIYLYEVAPAVHENLRGGHGVWDAFDAEWLRKKILKNMLNPQYAQEALKNREYLTEFVARDWERIKKHVQEIRRSRGMSPAEQRGIIALLQHREKTGS